MIYSFNLDFTHTHTQLCYFVLDRCRRDERKDLGDWDQDLLPARFKSPFSTWTTRLNFWNMCT